MLLPAKGLFAGDPQFFLNKVDDQISYIMHSAKLMYKEKELEDENIEYIKKYIKVTIQAEETYIEALTEGSDKVGQDTVKEALENLVACLYALTAKAIELGIPVLEEKLVCPTKRKRA